MRPDLWRKSLTLVFSTALLGASSCGSVEKSATCNLKGDGLRLAPYNGENLVDLQVSLVFLKGPSDTTEAIGHYLEEQHVPATFFVKGSEVEKHESAVDKLVEQGHRIGTGGFSFAALKDAEDPVLELRSADELVTPFAYGNQFFFYGEAGSLDNEALTQLKRAGLGKYVGPIHADTGSALFVSDEECWNNNISVSTCVEGYFNEIVRLGHGIIPFHDEDPRTLQLLEELIPELTAFGFTYQRLDQIPDIRLAITANGGTPDSVKGAEVCNDYE